MMEGGVGRGAWRLRPAWHMHAGISKVGFGRPLFGGAGGSLERPYKFRTQLPLLARGIFHNAHTSARASEANQLERAVGHVLQFVAALVGSAKDQVSFLQVLTRPGAHVPCIIVLLLAFLCSLQVL